MEPYLVVALILIAGLIATIVHLATNSIDLGTIGYYWAQDFPLHCLDQNIECIRSENAIIQQALLLDVPLIGNVLLVSIFMWKICVSLQEQDCKNASHNFQSSIRHSRRHDEVQEEEISCPRRRASLIVSPEELYTIQYRKSCKARQLILQYFVGYFLTCAFLWIYFIFHSAESIDNLFERLTMVFYSIGGGFNSILFVLPALRIVHEGNVDLCLCRALVSAIISYAGPSNGASHVLRRGRRRASITTQSQANPSNIEEYITNDRIDRN